MYETLLSAMGRDSLLRISCGGCGHAVAWSRRRALGLFDPYSPPYILHRRLRCGKCGAKRARLWVDP
jgi:ribosomal protein S27AE